MSTVAIAVAVVVTGFVARALAAAHGLVIVRRLHIAADPAAAEEYRRSVERAEDRWVARRVQAALRAGKSVDLAKLTPGEQAALHELEDERADQQSTSSR